MVAAATSNNIHEVNVILLLIFLSISGHFIHQTNARKCYVCGPNANIPLKMSNDKLSPSSSIINKESPSIIESCDNFQTTNNDNQNVNVNQKFIMDCPLNFQGCLTFINGTMITRTCEEADVNDCQMVNNIKYCICDYDLCNLNDTDYDYNNDNDNKQIQHKQSVNKQQKQKDTISVTDIKSYHLSYNKMKPSVLLTNSNNNNNNSSNKNSLSFRNDTTGHHQQHSNNTFTTTPALNNNNNNSSMTPSQMGSSNVQSLAAQKNNYNHGSNFGSMNNNSNSLPSYPRMNGTNQLPVNYNNMDINKSSKENGNQKMKFCWMYLILVAAAVFEWRF